jgi:hypothetical protein
MSACYSRRFWHLRDISAYGVISEVPVLRFCRLKASAWTGSKRPNRSLESCGMNSRTFNGLLSGRFCRTSRVAFPVARPERHLLGPALRHSWRDLPVYYGPAPLAIIDCRRSLSSSATLKYRNDTQSLELSSREDAHEYTGRSRPARNA